ncbi:hypothetical protein D3C71_1981040 [compost metagenome]
MVGVVRPAIRFSSVDLPQPECPISVMNSPSAMPRLMSRRATNGPLRVLKVWPTFSMLTNFSMAMAPSGGGQLLP